MGFERCEFIGELILYGIEVVSSNHKRKILL